MLKKMCPKWLQLVFFVVAYFIPEPGHCQNSKLKVNCITEFTMYTYNVDWSDTNSKSFITLQNDTEAALRKTLIGTLSFVKYTALTRRSDGLFQVHFQLQGDATNTTLWLKSLAEMGIIVGGRTIPVLVGVFNTKGKLLRVNANRICDTRDFIQPCTSQDECNNGVCIPRQVFETTQGNLIVLAYGGAFILASILVIIVGCSVAVQNRRRSSKNPPKSSIDNGIKIDGRISI